MREFVTALLMLIIYNQVNSQSLNSNHSDSIRLEISHLRNKTSELRLKLDSLDKENTTLLKNLRAQRDTILLLNKIIEELEYELVKLRVRDRSWSETFDLLAQRRDSTSVEQLSVILANYSISFDQSVKRNKYLNDISDLTKGQIDSLINAQKSYYKAETLPISYFKNSIGSIIIKSRVRSSGKITEYEGPRIKKRNMKDVRLEVTPPPGDFLEYSYFVTCSLRTEKGKIFRPFHLIRMSSLDNDRLYARLETDWQKGVYIFSLSYEINEQVIEAAKYELIVY